MRASKYKKAQIISISKRDAYYADRLVLKNAIGKFRLNTDWEDGYFSGNFIFEKAMPIIDEKPQKKIYFAEVIIKYL